MPPRCGSTRTWTRTCSPNPIESSALPISTPVSQLRIHLSETRPTPLNWQYVGEGNADPCRATADRRTAGARRVCNAPGKRGRLSLRTPQATPFEIRGQRRTRFASALAVSLATLPAAVSHEGRLTIRSSDGTRLSIKANSVRPIPSEPAPPDSCPTAVAAYQYDASRNRSGHHRSVHRSGLVRRRFGPGSAVTSQYLETGRRDPCGHVPARECWRHGTCSCDCPQEVNCDRSTSTGSTPRGRCARKPTDSRR